jgi:hypothetical protein
MTASGSLTFRHSHATADRQPMNVLGSPCITSYTCPLVYLNHQCALLIRRGPVLKVVRV